MDFKHYQYIIRVAELQNITKAAQSLYISQPSLSTFIVKVEDELGTVIFDRTKSPLELTPAGEAYVRTGREILRLHDEMRREVIEISQKKKGRIKIGIPVSRASYMLPLIYPNFHKEFPNIELETVEKHFNALLEDLSKREIDIAIMPQLISAKEFHCDLIYQEELLLIAQKGYLDEKEKYISNMQELMQYPFILLRQGHAARLAIDDFFRRRSMTPKILFETSNNSTALRLAASGEGLAIVPQMTIEITGKVENMDAYRLLPEGLKWDISAIRRTENRKDYILNELIHIAQEVFDNK